jgi:alanyl-tRNA synthetase
MKWTGLNELREEFLEFFRSKGHLILASAPLVPKDDPSLLLINSGMAPLKNFFTGVQTSPSKRIATCQKCIRTPDIERVGKTARHGTYFEMLGNFSFGDYFKHEAIAWAWEFVTQKLNLPIERLWVTIYQDDDEAFDIWVNEIGVAPEKVVRMGKEDNFWEIGTGPCGPCSEIYFDRGEGFGCQNPDCAVGCDCDRFVEFWNLVFTQFDSDGKGNYTPLEHPNIDTGMGLERIACIMQGVDNLFEVDTVARIMEHIGQIAGIEYKINAERDISLRVITDHIRSTVMMIGDGVVPSNEGRGYVLRRLLRRAARHGRLIGIDKPFLYEVGKTVIEENLSAYPALSDNRDYILRVVRMEEERFLRTIGQGMELLERLVGELKAKGKSRGLVLPGQEAFRLYDTFGFPVDLTREILAEQQIGLDEEGFWQLMGQQKERARAARADLGEFGHGDGEVGSQTGCFVGYDKTACDAAILAITANKAPAQELGEGEQGVIVLDCTPFYAESGGQVGDTGTISAGGAVFEVRDCKMSASGNILHIGHMAKGSLISGQAVRAEVDFKRRLSVMRNHTAAHLLQKALRELLGSHVHQAGQLVDENACRFDFTHFAAVSRDELIGVEALVNEMILSGMDVKTFETSQSDARALGAIALFSEKYDDTVRVVDMGGQALELCGGTHLDNTAKVGLFKILKESSVAAGVRRIEAVTGEGVLRHIDDLESILHQTAEALRTGAASELPSKAAAMAAQLKENERRLDSLSQKMADAEMQVMLAGAKQVAGVKFFTASFDGARPDALRRMGDRLREQRDAVAGVLVSSERDKAYILAAASGEAVRLGFNAGELVKNLSAKAGGSGGGRRDSAMGGTSELEKLSGAVLQAEQLFRQMMEK